MEAYLDDNVIIPVWIKKMSREERQAEIKRLEKEAAREKSKIELREKEAAIKKQTNQI